MTSDAPVPAGWLRGPVFDGLLIGGCAILALGTGCVVAAWPEWFPVVFLLNQWLLGQHHVMATYTRLALDRESFAEHRFLVLGLPWIVLAATVLTAYLTAGWAVLVSIYLYWQWFHYTRQSYGIAQIYRRKVPAQSPADDRLTRAMLYGVALWGILSRSCMAAKYGDRFLGMEFRPIPVPPDVVVATGIAACALLLCWSLRQLALNRQGRLSPAHTAYLASHAAVFLAGYVAFSDLSTGWLVLNVWHNAQYLMIVWLYNNNRFRNATDPRRTLLSRISQSSAHAVILYVAVCLGGSAVLYYGLIRIGGWIETLGPLPILGALGIPLVPVGYQVINFHHYIVDGLIWKVRRPEIREKLGIAEA